MLQIGAQSPRALRERRRKLARALLGPARKFSFNEVPTSAPENWRALRLVEARNKNICCSYVSHEHTSSPQALHELSTSAQERPRKLPCAPPRSSTKQIARAPLGSGTTNKWRALSLVQVETIQIWYCVPPGSVCIPIRFNSLWSLLCQRHATTSNV